MLPSGLTNSGGLRDDVHAIACCRGNRLLQKVTRKLHQALSAAPVGSCILTAPVSEVGSQVHPGVNPHTRPALMSLSRSGGAPHGGRAAYGHEVLTACPSSLSCHSLPESTSPFKTASVASRSGL